MIRWHTQPEIRNYLAIAYSLGKTLHEILPDAYPANMSHIELELWGLYVESLKPPEKVKL